MRLFGCHGNNHYFSFHGNQSVFKINETCQYTYFRKHFPVLSSFMIYYRLVNIVKGLVPLVVEADEGDYACQATNIAESASSSNSRLIVNGGKLIQHSLLTEDSHFSQLMIQ